MARRILGVNGNAMASDVTVDFAAMVTDALLLNVNGVMVEASMALFVPSGETAMFTEFNVTGVAQVPLENLIRNESPPMDTRTICRNVLLAK